VKSTLFPAIDVHKAPAPFAEDEINELSTPVVMLSAPEAEYESTLVHQSSYGRLKLEKQKK